MSAIEKIKSVKEVELYKLVNSLGETVFKGFPSYQVALEAWDEHESDSTFDYFKDNGMFQRDDFPEDCKIISIEKYQSVIKNTKP